MPGQKIAFGVEIWVVSGDPRRTIHHDLGSTENEVLQRN